MKVGLFVDRDGTLNVDKGYTHRPEDLVLVDGASGLLRFAEQQGFVISIVSNQSGIARGMYSEADFQNFTNSLIRALELKGGSDVEVRFCPHLPESSCQCRKPAPGMIIEIAKIKNICLEHSVFVGDTDADLWAGIHANVGFIFKLTKGETGDMKIAHSQVVLVQDLKEALEQIRKLDLQARCEH